MDGLKGPWSVSRDSRHCPEPRRFLGDPASLARDNIYFIVCGGFACQKAIIQKVNKEQATGKGGMVYGVYPTLDE